MARARTGEHISTDEINLEVDLSGELDLDFKSEMFPLERFAHTGATAPCPRSERRGPSRSRPSAPHAEPVDTRTVIGVTADFFEAMYAGAGGDDAGVPWQHAMSRRFIGEWFDTFEPEDRQRALVVAAGLGDDAAALARLGLDVVAFDFAPTAVDWARSRHPGVDVDWQVADLFAPPATWIGSFDLVVEVFTIQSIRPADQAEAAAAVRGFVGPGGRMVAVTLVHDGSRDPPGPPWPIHPATLDLLTDGLVESARRTEHLDDGVRCIRVELDRPGR